MEMEIALNDVHSVVYTTGPLVAQTAKFREMWFSKLTEFESERPISMGLKDGICIFRSFLKNLIKSPYYQE